MRHPSIDEERSWELLPALVRQQIESTPILTLEQGALTTSLLTEQLLEVAWRNLTSGRIRRVMVTSGRYPTLSQEALNAYVARLVAYYLQEHERLTLLETGNTTAWQELRTWLVRRATTMLRRWNASDASAPDAHDFAHDVCATLRAKLSQYPFDAPFYAWVTRILHTTIATRFTRSRDILDRRSDVASLNLHAPDDPEHSSLLVRWVTDPHQLSHLEQVEASTLVAHALEHLENMDQRAVLVYTYFHDLPDAEISRRIGKSVGNVAQLRFRALRKLRRILGAE